MKLKEILLREEAYALPAGKDRKELVWYQIEKYVSSKPKFFITMTAINKVGINPKFSYGNPVGIYCYQLSPAIFAQLKNNKLPFVANQPYINVITVTDPILYIENYTEQSYQKDKELVKKEFKGSEEKWERFVDDCEKGGTNRYSDTPFGKLWYLTREFARRTDKSSQQAVVIAWRKILITLGYPNIADPGEGIIHPSEPEQSLLMDVPQIKIVKTFLNPYAGAFKTDLADPNDKKTISKKTKQQSSTIDKDGKYTVFNDGVRISETWLEPNDNGVYKKTGLMRRRAEPSNIYYDPYDSKHIIYIWERGPDVTLRRIKTSGSGGTTFYHKSNTFEISYKEIGIGYFPNVEILDKTSKWFYVYITGDDKNLNSGRLIVSHTHIPSKDFYFYFENDKWEIAPEQKEELAEFLEKNGLKSPKPIKLPDASFFETQMKMPM